MITSRDNPKILSFCRLRDKSSERAARGMFTLEGARIITDALNEHVGISEAFYTAEALEKYPECTARLIEECGGEAYEISPSVAEKLGDTKAPQGVFAVAVGLDKSDKNCKIEDKGKFVVLNGLQDPGNIGTILRCADAVGVSGVYLCGCCDLYNPKLIRATMGSLFRLRIERREYFSLISELNSRGVLTCAAVVDKDAESVRDFKFPENCAAVIGNEGRGLSAEEAAACVRRITIRMSGTIESLNAASAASIIMWELTRGNGK